MILAESILADTLLPYNMPTTSKGNVLFDVTKLQNDLFPAHKTFPKQPFDQAYWITEETSTVAVPWLPFFSYCKGHGRYPMLYNLLEDADKCKLVSPENTLIVNEIPTNGRFTAVSDKCDYSLECQFEEDLSGSLLRGTKWWESDRDLYYLTTYGITADQLIKNRNDQVSQLFANYLVANSTTDLIPVFFHPIE